MHKRLLLNFFFCLFALVLSTRLHAQGGKDAQFWLFIKLEKKITKKFGLELDQQSRLTNNMSNLSFAFLDGGIRYKYNKHLHLGASYVYVLRSAFYNKNNSDLLISNRHQYYGFATFIYSPGRWQFSNRCMYQAQVKDIRSSEDGYIPDKFYRNKITAQYELNKKISPFLSTEFYIYLNSNSPFGNQLNRMRYFAGIDYKFSNKSTCTLYYLIQNAHNSKFPETLYVLGLNFNYKFR